MKMKYLNLSSKSKIFLLLYFYLFLLFNKNIIFLSFFIIINILFYYLIYNDLKFILKFLFFISFFGLFFSFYNFLFFHEGSVVYQFYFIKIYDKAFYMAIGYLLRVSSLGLITITIMKSINDEQIVYLTNYYLSFFKKINANKISMIIMVSFKFIPTIINDYRDISLAVKIKTNEKKTGIIKRFNNLILSTPAILKNNIKKADQISNLLDVKGFNYHKKRTIYYQELVLWNEYILILFIIVLTFYFNNLL